MFHAPKTDAVAFDGLNASICGEVGEHLVHFGRRPACQGGDELVFAHGVTGDNPDDGVADIFVARKVKFTVDGGDDFCDFAEDGFGSQDAFVVGGRYPGFGRGGGWAG